METTMLTSNVTTVNFHLVKHCPMACNFCYARYDDVIRDTGVQPLGLSHEKALTVIAETATLGFKKINFAGGEPLLRKDLPELICYAKSLGLTTSIISNGQLLTADWAESVKGVLDQIGISVDSALPERRVLMGRAINKKPLSNPDYFSRAKVVHEARISLKINSVVTATNSEEDLSDFISQLKPSRWKVFQALQIDGQNNLDASAIRCPDEAFKAFKERHQHLEQKGIRTVFEGNEDMTGSYAMIDPAGRFYDNVAGKHRYSLPVWQVGGVEAFSSVVVDAPKFFARGGSYNLK
jgi:radical S-adenosyl methionine domain-containing protein 2